MGQYHILINRDATEHVFPHTLGNGLKAWEQTAGGHSGRTGFFTCRPPRQCAWRCRASSARRPLGRPAYPCRRRLCRRQRHSRFRAQPTAEPHLPPMRRSTRSCRTAHALQQGHDNAERKGDPPYSHARNAVSRGAAGIHPAHREIPAPAKPRATAAGPIEHALSVRFVATSTRTFHDVPVKPFAIRKEDGELHYELPERLLRPQTGDDHWELGVIWRMCDLGGWRNDPAPDPLNLPEGLARWPWDRAPRDMTFHNASDADQDLGQQRVYANLDRREFFDPGIFGEVPTTLGLMRAAASCPPLVPDIVIGGGKTAVTPKSEEAGIQLGRMPMGHAAASEIARRRRH